ncbi:MAG: hypothetical protein ACUVRZ_00845 [Desulfobacca sp.]|uniref:hypothetical protein n=1 Tax=Desulfobacca sp. TaxID=2067990 RepID=UPI00404BA01D
MILKNDFAFIETAILELAELPQVPGLSWVDNSAVQVEATPDCKARVLLAGFPSPLHAGLLVTGGLSDGKYRENAATVMMDFDNPAHSWGTEKSNQWYVIYAVAAAVDTTFSLKAMPLMRCAAQAAQVITLRNNANTANIGYGFASNELQNGKILVLTGAARGLLRTITANNNDNGTGGTITYTGSTLSLAAGDWFVVLPSGVSCRYLGMIFNNSAGNIQPFKRQGRSWRWQGPLTWLTGAVNGWTLENLDLVAPLTARVVHAVAHADYGYTLKWAFSHDGNTWNQLVHAGYPGSGFKGSGAAVPCSFVPRPDHSIYVDNENTAGQHLAIVGWEE